jgi:hypothetical protein
VHIPPTGICKMGRTKCGAAGPGQGNEADLENTCPCIRQAQAGALNSLLVALCKVAVSHDTGTRASTVHPCGCCRRAESSPATPVLLQGAVHLLACPLHVKASWWHPQLSSLTASPCMGAGAAWACMQSCLARWLGSRHVWAATFEQQRQGMPQVKPGQNAACNAAGTGDIRFIKLVGSSMLSSTHDACHACAGQSACCRSAGSVQFRAQPWIVR